MKQQFTEQKLKLFIVTGNRFVGGNELGLMRLAQELSKRNYIVTVVAYAKRKMAKFFRSFKGIHQICLLTEPPHSKSLIQKFLKDPPDLILSSGPGLAVEMAQQYKKPLFLRIVNNPNWQFGNTGFLTEQTKQIIKMMGAFSKRLIALSNSVKAPFLKLGINHFETIYNGCDTEFFRPASREKAAFRRRFNVPVNNITIGVVANILPQKRHEIVIRALSELPEDAPSFKCFFIGSYDQKKMKIQKKKLNRLIKKFNLGKKIIFTGFLNDRKEFMNGLDIHLFPFQGEGCTNTLLEAMACEKAVIAHNSGPFPEMISRNQEGVVVPEEDPKAFAQALYELLGNRELRLKLGKKARLKVQQKFNRKKQVDAYDYLFRSSLEHSQYGKKLLLK